MTPSWRWRAAAARFLILSHPAAAAWSVLVWALLFILLSVPIGVPPVAAGVAGACGGVLATTWPWTNRVRSAYSDVVVRVGIITTDRLVLRPMHPGDAKALAQLWDEEFMVANGWTPATCASALEALRRLPLRLAREFAVEERTTGKLIGTINVYDVDVDDMKCSLGWMIGPPWRRQGYGTEAVPAVLAGLHRIGIGSIRIGTRTTNLAVRRVAEKAGAVLVEQNDHTLPDGTCVESVWYEHVPR